MPWGYVCNYAIVGSTCHINKYKNRSSSIGRILIDVIQGYSRNRCIPSQQKAVPEDELGLGGWKQLKMND
jgi:hypothetical protein